MYKQINISNVTTSLIRRLSPSPKDGLISEVATLETFDFIYILTNGLETVVHIIEVT